MGLPLVIGVIEVFNEKLLANLKLEDDDELRNKLCREKLWRLWLLNTFQENKLIHVDVRDEDSHKLNYN